MREEENREKNSLLATEISVARERERRAEEYEEEERVREEEKREKNSLLATEISVARERERDARKNMRKRRE